MTRTTVLTVVFAALLLVAAIWFGTSVMQDLGHRAVDSGILEGLQ